MLNCGSLLIDGEASINNHFLNWLVVTCNPGLVPGELQPIVYSARMGYAKCTYLAASDVLLLVMNGFNSVPVCCCESSLLTIYLNFKLINSSKI